VIPKQSFPTLLVFQKVCILTNSYRENSTCNLFGHQRINLSLRSAPGYFYDARFQIDLNSTFFFMDASDLISVLRIIGVNFKQITSYSGIAVGDQKVCILLECTFKAHQQTFWNTNSGGN